LLLDESITAKLAVPTVVAAVAVQRAVIAEPGNQDPPSVFSSPAARLWTMRYDV